MSLYPTNSRIEKPERKIRFVAKPVNFLMDEMVIDGPPLTPDEVAWMNQKVQDFFRMQGYTVDTGSIAAHP